MQQTLHIKNDDTVLVIVKDAMTFGYQLDLRLYCNDEKLIVHVNG
jgi:hypothetical protein